ncbi:MAG: hypothetical protein L3J82_05395 [Planctomycetes bacterium]|nr:hypothetical protein [Planctomycetota bacterium]
MALKTHIKVSLARRKSKHSNGVFHVTFRHPAEWQDPRNRSKGRKVYMKTLGTKDYDEAKFLHAKLEEIVNNEELHKFVPQDTPRRVREIWLGMSHDLRVKTKLGTVELSYSENAEKDVQLIDKRDDGDIKNFLFGADEEPTDPNEYLELIETKHGHTADTTTLAEEVIRLKTEIHRLQGTTGDLHTELKFVRDENKVMSVKLRQANIKAGKKFDVGTLGEEAKKYLEWHDGTKKKKVWKSKVRSAVTRFVERFGSERKTLEIDEKEVNRYVQTYKKDNGQPPKEESRRKIRQIVCTFLNDATHGAFDGSEVKSIGQHKVEAEKEKIVWLEPDEAKKLVKAMYALHGNYWGDLAAFQLYTGFRASEIAITLKENIKPLDKGARKKGRGRYKIQFVPLKDERDGTYTGKTGGRSIQGRTELDRIIKRRLADKDGKFLFNRIKRYSPKTNKLIKRKDGATGLLADAWNQEAFFKEYRQRLRAAAEEIGITKQIRCHLLRRTFASIAIRCDPA